MLIEPMTVAARLGKVNVLASRLIISFFVCKISRKDLNKRKKNICFIIKILPLHSKIQLVACYCCNLRLTGNEKIRI